MKLSEYAKYINGLMEDGLGDAIVISASDEEGNSFSEVFNQPEEIKHKNFADSFIDGEVDYNSKYVIIN